jgi:hypothetical protein
MTVARRAVLVLLAVLALAPASAHAGVLEWRDAGVEAPQTHDLRAVAAEGSTVVAVGTDRTTNEVVVYRRVGDTWRRDLPLSPPPEFVPEPVIDPETGEPMVDPETGEPVMTEPPPPPPKTYGDLVDVAVSGASAWAVGTAPDGSGGQRALLLRLQGDEWGEVEAPASMGAPRALALAGDDGLVGDALGQVFEITDGVVAGTPLSPAGVVPPPKTPVNGLALTGAARAWGVAEPGDRFSGFLDVNGESGEIRQDVSETMPAGKQLVAVAASSGQAVAIDGGGPCRESVPDEAPNLWTRDSSLNLWRHETPAASADGTRWCDLSLVGGTLLIAGDRATATGRVGAIWRRVGTGTLRLEDDLDGRELHGVAQSGTEAWAVGESGALWRYAEWPVPPPPPDDDDEDDDDKGDPTPPQDDGGDQPLPPAEEQPAPPPSEPAPAPETIVTPLDPSGRTTTPAKRRRPKPSATTPARRLLVGLKARRSGRRLVLSFRLRVRARVLVTALRGTQVVARVRSRPLRPGARRLVIRFRGRKPPTQLKIVVRPVGGPGANKEGKGS